MSLKLNCPICDFTTADSRPSAVANDEVINVSCKRCGNFAISIGVKLDTPNYKLSAFLRDANLDKRQLQISNNNLNDVVSSIGDKSVSEKIIALLGAFAKLSKHPGDKVFINGETDFPLAWADSQREFNFILDALVSQGDVRNAKAGNFQITASGWTHIESHRTLNPSNRQVFVAMSFSESMKVVWLPGFKAGIEAAGYSAYRVDGVPHNNRIDAKIMADIKESKFVVADFTEQKAGVYFEAGYALGLGIPVIWCVRKDDLENVHFDTRQYGHIVWENAVDLSEKLNDYIVAIIGKA